MEDQTGVYYILQGDVMVIKSLDFISVAIKNGTTWTIPFPKEEQAIILAEFYLNLYYEVKVIPVSRGWVVEMKRRKSIEVQN